MRLAAHQVWICPDLLRHLYVNSPTRTTWWATAAVMQNASVTSKAVRFRFLMASTTGTLSIFMMATSLSSTYCWIQTSVMLPLMLDHIHAVWPEVPFFLDAGQESSPLCRSFAQPGLCDGNHGAGRGQRISTVCLCSLGACDVCRMWRCETFKSCPTLFLNTRSLGLARER